METKWKYGFDDDSGKISTYGGGWIVTEDEKETIVRGGYGQPPYGVLNEANAEHICHCVNSYDALLEACKYAVTALKRQEVGMVNHEAIEGLKRAIANAESEV